MPFSFTVSLNDPNHLPQDAALLAAVQAAAADWSQALNGFGSLDILVKVEATASGRASGGSETTTFWDTDGSRSIFQQGALAELITGIDPNGSTPDAIITVDPTYLLEELWFDPDPAHPQPVPDDRTDAASVFRHELGHALGMSGWRDLPTGTLPATYGSTWDALVEIRPDGSASFMGAHARAVYGGDVPVTILANGQAYFREW